MDFSHEGGEYKAFAGLSHQVVSLSGCHYIDPCTHHNHIEIQTGNWKNQLNVLVDTYLNYCSQDEGNGMLSIPETVIMPDGLNCLSLADIELVDMFGVTTLQPQPLHTYSNKTLIYH
ncbi:uncharacterized protein BJ212DRAFT_1208925, partial [Suillus subaureus]